MYKYYKNDKGEYVIEIIVPGFLSKGTTHTYICQTEEQVKALIVPNGHHIGDPGLEVTPTVVKDKSPHECVIENDKIHDKVHVRH